MTMQHVWHALDRAIEHGLDEDPGYPHRAWLVNPEDPGAGSTIARALDDGWTVVLVSADGRERILTAAQSAV